MKYAAKRTWPDRPKAWEQQGEADNLESFALAFASELGLGVGTEFVVLDKDSEDANLESFRVTGTDPYTLGPADARTAETAATEQSGPLLSAGPGAAAGGDPPPFVNAAASFMFYMVKVAVLALVVLGTLFYLLKRFGLTPPP
ncbi:MAG TPA: hypothetical protein VES73_18545 [Lamprocystis sp. (in: g-proteobacteria)]|nr:hypothetical protein [Lamprocystis sp. (in: g-proteobacteria)]